MAETTSGLRLSDLNLPESTLAPGQTPEADEQFRESRRQVDSEIAGAQLREVVLANEEKKQTDALEEAKRNLQGVQDRVAASATELGKEDAIEKTSQVERDALLKTLTDLNNNIYLREQRLKEIKNGMRFFGKAKELWRRLLNKKTTVDDDAQAKYNKELGEELKRKKLAETPTAFGYRTTPLDKREEEADVFVKKQLEAESDEAKNVDLIREALIQQIEEAEKRIRANEARKTELTSQIQAATIELEKASGNIAPEVNTLNEVTAAREQTSTRVTQLQEQLAEVESQEVKYWEDLKVSIATDKKDGLGDVSPEELAKWQADKVANEARGAERAGREVELTSAIQASLESLGKDTRKIAEGLLGDENGLLPLTDVIRGFVDLTESGSKHFKKLGDRAREFALNQADLLKIVNGELRSEFNNKLAAHADEVYAAFGILDGKALELRLSILREDPKLEALEKKRDAGDAEAARELKRLRKLAEKRVETFMKNHFALIDEADKANAEWANRVLYPDLLKSREARVFSAEATANLLAGLSKEEQELILNQKYGAELDASIAANENLRKLGKLVENSNVVVDKIAEEVVYQDELLERAKEDVEQARSILEAQQQVEATLTKNRQKLLDKKTTTTAGRVSKRDQALSTVTLELDSVKKAIEKSKKALAKAKSRLAQAEQQNDNANVSIRESYLPVEARGEQLFPAGEDGTSVAGIYNDVMSGRLQYDEYGENPLPAESGVLVRYEPFLKELPSKIESAIEKRRKQREAERSGSAESAQERIEAERRAAEVRLGREQGQQGFESAYDVLTKMNYAELEDLLRTDTETTDWLVSDRERKLAEYTASIVELNDTQEAAKLDRLLTAILEVRNDPQDVRVALIRNLRDGLRLTA